MQAFKVILGTSGKSYSLTIENNGEYFLMPSVTIDTKNTYILTLKALLGFIETLSKNVHEKVELYYYCTNFDVCYEWNNDYKKHKKFSQSVKSLELWEKILVLLEKYDITLYIKNNNYLSFISKVNKCN